MAISGTRNARLANTAEQMAMLDITRPRYITTNDHADNDETPIRPFLSPIARMAEFAKVEG